MKTIIFLLAALFTSHIAHAIVFEVRGYNGELLYKQSYPMGNNINAGKATIDFLDFAVNQKKLTYVGTQDGIQSINDLGSKTETEGNGLRAYGWCYSINGVSPDRMPNEVYIPSDNSRLVWYYAFGRLIDGEWLDQCVPATR